MGPHGSCAASEESPELLAGSSPERMIAGFAAALRRAGLVEPVGSVVDFAEAVGLVGLDSPEQLYWAGRATLVRRPEEIGTYDRVFNSFWRRAPFGVDLAPPPAEQVVLGVDEGPEGEGESGTEQPNQDHLSLRWSAFEVLRSKDLAELSPAEWQEAARMIAAMRFVGQMRPSRRRRRSRRRNTRARLHLGATVRASLATGGLPVRRVWTEATQRPRRLVMLLDVSGSMEAYSRGLARFAHAAITARRSGRVEVFTMGTRLTRITKELSGRDPDRALAQAARSVPDWAGGTRLGESLGEFNSTWGVRGMARGSVTVICSDGWDRGDPGRVSEEMARLKRVAHEVVWVNPLKASPGYAPLARGMAAALPYVDVFLEGHSLASLEQLAAVVSGSLPSSRFDMKPRSEEGRG